MFFDISRWEDKIEHGFDKGINQTILRKMCQPLVRGDLCKLMLTDKYSVAPPHIALIPKDDGSMRKVFANEDEDRIILSIINDVYYELYKDKIHPNCVSYQKGMSVQTVIKNITEKLQQNKQQGGKIGYKVDLSKYFDSVNKETLFKALKEMDTGSIIDSIVQQYYSTDLVFDEDGNLMEHYKSLAQGCALGAFLANYVLRDVDMILSSLDIIYYRYSDDIVLIGEEADIALGLLHSLLEEKGLSLNPKKVQSLITGEKFVFLGYELTTDGQHIDLSPNKIKKYKHEIKLLTKSRKGMKTQHAPTMRQVTHSVLHKTYAGVELKGKMFGWMDRCSIVTELPTIQMLDNYVKDSLKQTWTGKYNHKHNENHCSKDVLESSGYKSMVMMYKALVTSRDVYNQLRRDIG